MSRWIVPAKRGLVRETADSPTDDALTRIVKYVPAEVLVAFTSLFTLLTAGQIDPERRPWAATGLIVLFLIVTIVYVLRKAPQGTSRNFHLLISSLAFLAWAYPISSSALGCWFFPLAAFAAQAIVLALSIIQPFEEH